jgi:hypothetical protein
MVGPKCPKCGASLTTEHTICWYCATPVAPPPPPQQPGSDATNKIINTIAGAVLGVFAVFLFAVVVASQVKDGSERSTLAGSATQERTETTQGATTAPRQSGSPSAGCLEAMRRAANEPDDVLADPLLRQSAYACDSVDEWLTALRRYPEAMAVSSASAVGTIDVVALCLDPGLAGSPVCSDARSRGLLD